MCKKDLSVLLCQKAYKEQSDFVEELKKLPPKEIIEKSYEKTIRDDIVFVFEGECLSEEQVKELLKLDHPLAACYYEWLDTDYSHMDMLGDTVRGYADLLIKENTPQKTITA